MHEWACAHVAGSSFGQIHPEYWHRWGTLNNPCSNSIGLFSKRRHLSRKEHGADRHTQTKKGTVAQYWNGKHMPFPGFISFCLDSSRMLSMLGHGLSTGATHRRGGPQEGCWWENHSQRHRRLMATARGLQCGATGGQHWSWRTEGSWSCRAQSRILKGTPVPLFFIYVAGWAERMPAVGGRYIWRLWTKGERLWRSDLGTSRPFDRPSPTSCWPMLHWLVTIPPYLMSGHLQFSSPGWVRDSGVWSLTHSDLIRTMSRAVSAKRELVVWMSHLQSLLCGWESNYAHFHFSFFNLGAMCPLHCWGDWINETDRWGQVWGGDRVGCRGTFVIHLCRSRHSFRGDSARLIPSSDSLDI